MLLALRRLAPVLALIAAAAAVLLASDRRARRPSRELPPAVEPAAGRPWKIHVVQLLETVTVEEARQGVLAGLADAGLSEGKDFVVTVHDAQGEVASLGPAFDAARAAGADLVVSITAPALEAGLAMVSDRPLVFTLSIDPLVAGEKGSHSDHRPNVAGVYTVPPASEALAVVRSLVPGARRVGTLVAPVEVNSTLFRKDLEAAGVAAGIEVVAVASSSPQEVGDAAFALLAQRVDAVCQVPDNLHTAAFPTLVAACRSARVPLVGLNSRRQADQGAVVAVCRDRVEEGREAGLLAARILRGESPASMPYRSSSRVLVVVNRGAAAAIGLELPGDLLARADAVVVGDERARGRRRPSR